MELTDDEMEECPHCGADLRSWETCECESADLELDDDAWDNCNECGLWTFHYELDDDGVCVRCLEEKENAN